MRPYLFFFLILLSPAGFTSEQVRGKLSVTGEIIESACSIATDDIWQEIDFGDVVVTDIMQGKRPEKELKIHLVNCRLEKNSGVHWNTTTLTFDGPVGDAKSGLFHLTGQGQGIGLQIIDSAGVVAMPSVELSAVNLNEGSTDINFKLALVNNGSQIMAGGLSSSLRFMVSNQ